MIHKIRKCFAFGPLAGLFVIALLFSGCATRPWNEAADAKLDIRRAVAAAPNKPVIVVFGANWCGDSRALAAAMKTGPTAGLLAGNFRIVKVDVRRFNKNVDVAESYGVPLKKGIPAVAIISPNNEVLYATREGELANAKKMGDDGIYQFFKSVTASVKRRG